MTHNSEDSKISNLPDWILQLRSQSWQIEILIAGSTMYSLFYLSDNLKSFFYATYPGIDFNITRTLTLFGVYLVTRILLIGFGANLLIRAVWLAYLGINFAFPTGINYDHLTTSEASKDLLRQKPTILDRVILLEKLAKLSYSLAVLIAIFTTSVFIMTILLHITLDILHLGWLANEAAFSYIVSIAIAVIQLGVIDRLILRPTSKYKSISHAKRLISTVLEYGTLSFLFRREFIAIKSNTNKWLLRLSVVSIMASASLLTAAQIGEYWPYGTLEVKFLDDRDMYDIDYAPYVSNNNYDEYLDGSKHAFRMSIQSQIIKDRYLRLFLVSWDRFDARLENSFEKFAYPFDTIPDTQEAYRSITLETDSIFNLVVNDLFLVEIDRKPLSHLRWKTARHHLTREVGYLSYIDIDSIDIGEHSIITSLQYTDNEGEVKTTLWGNAPFWKE